MGKSSPAAQRLVDRDLLSAARVDPHSARRDEASRFAGSAGAHHRRGVVPLSVAEAPTDRGAHRHIRSPLANRVAARHSVRRDADVRACALSSRHRPRDMAMERAGSGDPRGGAPAVHRDRRRRGVALPRIPLSTSHRRRRRVGRPVAAGGILCAHALGGIEHGRRPEGSRELLFYAITRSRNAAGGMPCIARKQR
jgi:hypothetical protein